MNPTQLHGIADSIRSKWPAPQATMDPQTYITCQAMHALADAITELAEHTEPDTGKHHQKTP